MAQRLVIISLTLFLLMKLVYGFFGDYTEEYWNLVYYIPLYILISSLIYFVLTFTVGKFTRLFLKVCLVYFLALLLLHVVILFKIDWYGPLIATAKWGVGAVVLVSGIAFINYIRIANVTKN